MSGKVARRLRKMVKDNVKAFIPRYNHIKERHLLGKPGKKIGGTLSCIIEAPARVYYKFLKTQYKKGLSIGI